LSACGGGGSDSSDKIATSAPPATSAAAPPTASTTPSDAANRPKITLPSDVKSTFTPESVGDPAKDAVLRDNADFLRTIDAAIVAQNPDYKPLAFYAAEDAAASTHDWVASFTKAGWTITGTKKYTKRVVTLKSATEASLSYCGDESKAYSKVIKTGKLEGTEVTKDSYVVYNTLLRKDAAHDVWKTVKIISSRGAAECQP
jgi:hypothetical protein